jgi:uncharacterized membrane protein
VLLNFSWCSQIWKWRINLPLVYLKYISMALHLFFCPGATAIPYCRLVPLTYTYSSHKHFRLRTFWEEKKKRMMDIFLSSIVIQGYTQNKLFFDLEVMLARYSLTLLLTHYSIGWNLRVSSNLCETPAWFSGTNFQNTETHLNFNL